MKNHVFNSAFASLLTVLIILSAIPFAVSAANIVDYGTNGDNLTWTLDSYGTLTISGDGEMGESHWYCNPNIKNVVINDGVTTISSHAFDECYNLSSVTLPDSLKSIGFWAFFSCSSLKKVYINSLTSWLNIDFDFYEANPLNGGADLYINNQLLTDLTVPDGTIEIKDYAFNGCKSLKRVNLPNSLKRIGQDAFSGCSAIDYVNTESIENWCNILFESNPLESGADFYVNNKLVTKLVIPDSITKISNLCFAGGESITSVFIPDNVVSIGQQAYVMIYVSIVMLLFQNSKSSL